MIDEVTRKNLGLGVIIGGNLVPFFGVLLWRWDLFSVFFLYWAENVVIGFYVLLMMLACSIRKGIMGIVTGLFTMAFFVFHYGLFCMAHVFFILGLFGPKMAPGTFMPEEVIRILIGPSVYGFFYALAGLVIVQGFQAYDAWRARYSKAKSVREIMAAPYGRIFVLHISILLGGMVAQLLGQPIWALMVLIGMKTLYDITAMKMREENVTPKNSQSA